MYPNMTPLLGTGIRNGGWCGFPCIPCLDRNRRQDEASVDPRREDPAPASVSSEIPVPCLFLDRGWILAAGPASDETASAASNPDALNDAVDGPTRGVPDKRPREKTVAAPSPPPSPSFTHLERFHLPFALGIRCRSLVRSSLYVGNFDHYVL